MFWGKTRNFGVRMLMAILIAYSILFALLAFVPYSPVIWLLIGFAFIVPVCQAYLFRGKRPWISSALGGAFAFMMVPMMVQMSQREFHPGDLVIQGVVGGSFGLIAGALFDVLFLLVRDLLGDPLCRGVSNRRK